MKKIILTFLFITILLAGCGQASKAKTSLNGVLQYNLEDDWQEMTEVQTATEIAIQKADNSIGFMAESISYNEDKPEDFIKYQENQFNQTGAVFEKDFSYEENGRKVTSKIFKASKDTEQNKFVVGTMELKDNKDYFVGYMCTLIDAKNAEEDIKKILNGIEFTGKTINQERYTVPQKEYFQFDLPADFRRTDRKSETNFIKTLEDGVIFSSMTTLRKDAISLEDQLKSLDDSFNQIFKENEVFKEKEVENFEDRDIYSKIYKYSLNGKVAYSYFGVVDFKNTNLMVNYVFDILTQQDFKNIQPELQKFVESIKLKKNAEKLIEKDTKELKKQIEKNQKELEKEMEKEMKKNEKEKQQKLDKENTENTESTESTQKSS